MKNIKRYIKTNNSNIKNDLILKPKKLLKIKNNKFKDTDMNIIMI